MPVCFSKNDINRFWSKVAITANDNKCWEWTAPLDHKGYGHLSYGAHSNYLSTRVSYFLEHKTDPGNLFVCHTCDNPKCVNPKHLFLGTQKQNLEDMVSKSRSCSYVKGEQKHSSRLTEKEVLEIRKMDKEGKSREEISQKFKIYKGHLCQILKRKLWNHI